MLETTPDGATHWSTRTLAKATGLSHGTIARIWRAFGLQPHRTKTFTLSPDPLLVEKVRDVVGLYLHPPDHALVLCVDEKSQIQALDRTQPLLPMQPGQTARHTHTYRRHGTTSLFAALDAQSGQVIGRTYRRHRAIEFRKFLDLIDAMSGARPRRPPDPRQLQHPQNAADPPVVGQRPRTSQSHPGHRIYPYLLRDLQITQPNHVWCTDVTYIPLQRGFLYLLAVMDWASRTVLSWRLSNTLEANFCVEALHEALERYGPRRARRLSRRRPGDRREGEREHRRGDPGVSR